jgi:Cu-Zn family superoxide dismutase|tara:strand:- start:528 stop:1280 length:753 start_codon:yes stop_codon:yes gene_type:complete
MVVHGVAVLEPDNSKVSGVVHFADGGSGVAISYHIKGLTDGKHGFHIHEYGDLTDGCTSACAHFNPDNTTHGSLTSKVRHMGDLGNIVSKSGVSKGELYLPKARLDSSKYGILGRMIIVHADEDDLGLGGLDAQGRVIDQKVHEESLKTGNAGKRVACGVIGLAEPPKKNAENIKYQANTINTMSFYTNPIVFTALAITSYGFYLTTKTAIATGMDKSISDREFWLSMLPGYALVAFGIGIMASMYPFKN